jgi:osmotically-inducible protein OsmY
LKSSSIKVLTENGVVYLMGIVSKQQADIAVDIARKVTGVQRVMKIFTYTAPAPT